MSEDRTRQLLNDLCVKLGFCLPTQDVERLVDHPPPDVLAFTDAVFLAEGLAPDTADRALYRRVRDMVAAALLEDDDD